MNTDFRFETYERLLWRVMAHLARHGYVAPPDEARDVIHDFFVEAWRGLTERYDSRRGSFPVYLYSAFYRFARRRITHLQNCRARLSSSGWFEHRSSPSPGPAEAVQRQEQIDAVRTALQKLPQQERDVLTGFLAEEAESERSLAAKHGMSRYRWRETLVDALGRLSTQLAPSIAEGSTDYKVAVALWRDGRTVRDTATLLALSVSRVREIRQHNVARLLSAIRGPQTSLRRENVEMNAHPLELLKKTLRSPDKQLLQEVRKHAGEIHEALEEQELQFSEDDFKSLEANPDWTAAVFDALAISEEFSDEEKEISEAIRRIRDDEDEQIAEAFVAALSTLPQRFHEWDRWFTDVERAPNEFQRRLREQRVVTVSSECAEYAAGLLVYGMTPATFVEASRGIELLVERLIRTALGSRERESMHSKDLQEIYRWIRERHEVGEPPCVDVVAHETRSRRKAGPAIPYDLALAEVRGTPQCPPDAAAPLLDWMVEAAQFKPFFFAGFEAATLSEQEIRLTQAAERGRDLVFRWSRHAEDAHAAMSAAVQ